jgi:pimeloyl-ACP methyl ester carboxylesterase
MVRLLDALKIERAVFVGHDWGGAVVWPLAQRHPDRGLAAASLCTPYPALAPAPPVSIMRKKFGEPFYIVQFQDEDLPDRVFGGREDLFFPFIFRPGPPRERWGDLLPGVLALPQRFEEAQGPFTDVVMPREALSVYIDAYRQSGHKTPTMVYRAIDEHWHERQDFDPPISLPSLMITASRDLMLPPEAAIGMEERIADLTVHEVDAGHWMMWEAPDDASKALIGWLRDKAFLTAR